MSKSIGWAALLAVTLFCTGCFEVIERIDLRDDGSGSFQFTLNMSKSKTKIASILNMKTINGRPVPTRPEIVRKVKEIESILKASPGISQVSSQLDMTQFIATIRCSFKDVTYLNQAARKIGEKQKAKAGGIRDHYAYQPQTKVFSRLAHFSLTAEYNKLSSADKEVFNGAMYTGILRFEKPVTRFSNPNARLSADRKAVMLKESILNIITHKKSIANTLSVAK